MNSEYSQQPRYYEQQSVALESIKSEDEAQAFDTFRKKDHQSKESSILDVSKAEENESS